MERFEIFTICRRPPVLQTDASVGMMKIVVRETEARKALGRGVEVHRPEALRASVSRTTIFIMPTLASVCSTGGRLQMVKI